MTPLCFLLLCAGTVSATPPQQVLQLPEQVSGLWSKPLQQLKSTLKGLKNEYSAVWDEVAMMFPESMEKASFFSAPKGHVRKPDSFWDTIVKGQEVEDLWIERDDGVKERQFEGSLSPYTLRSRAVDPSKLGVDPGVKQYSGYLDEAKDDKHLFYWFFESRGNPKTDPVVLWLNGGPGCSSLTGLFLELGPSRIDKNLKLHHNPHSWNSNASVIFLDQPVNVGYSYSDNAVSNSRAAGKDVYALLTLFFKEYPEYSHQDFHIAGESYAGHYIPVFTSEILSHKKSNINLKSILIGNGLTDPLSQYPAYGPMACGKGGWPAVLDSSTCQSMENALPRCLSLIETCYDTESVWTCVPASIYCNNAILGPYQKTGQNPYDVRKKCGDNPLCYEELDDISRWLNKQEVMQALGVEVESYDGCNFDINRDFLFQGDWMQPYHRLIPSILEKMPVLAYAGDADFICNWLGNAKWTDELEWDGGKAYGKSKMVDLNLGGDGKKIGEVKSSGNLTFMRIHAAGHMVPLDQPEASLDFFNRWLRGEWVPS